MLPVCSLCSKRIEKPLRSTASSAPKAGSWANSSAAAIVIGLRNRILEVQESIFAQLAAESQPQNVFQGPGHAAFCIAGRYPPAALLQFLRCISHDKGKPSKFKHFQVVKIVADGRSEERRV